MGFQKVEVMAEELRLDPDNPRLWNSQLENREDQGEIARELAGQTGASSILDDMLDGCYIAPEPFLGIRSPGGFTVVDGNKRNVCALEIARGGISPRRRPATGGREREPRGQTQRQPRRLPQA